jgi:hypothetical protein
MTKVLRLAFPTLCAHFPSRICSSTLPCIHLAGNEVHSISTPTFVLFDKLRTEVHGGRRHRHINWYHKSTRCIATMASAADPVTTTTFIEQLDHILVEMELINRRLDDHDNCIATMERNVSLQSLLVPSPPSAQLQPVPPAVAETFEGEAAHCFPSRGALLSVGTLALVARVSHDRAALARVQIETTLRVTAMPMPPPHLYALAVTHTRVPPVLGSLLPPRPMPILVSSPPPRIALRPPPEPTEVSMLPS